MDQAVLSDVLLRSVEAGMILASDIEGIETVKDTGALIFLEPDKYTCLHCCTMCIVPCGERYVCATCSRTAVERYLFTFLGRVGIDLARISAPPPSPPSPLSPRCDPVRPAKQRLSNADLEECHRRLFNTTEWLSDIVVDCYRSLLNDHPVFYFFNSYVLDAGPSKPPANYQGQAVMLLPLFINGNHWALAVFNYQDETIDYYDSLYDLTPKVADRLVVCYEHLKPWPGIPVHSKCPDVLNHGDYHLQKDAHSCGVYVLYWLRTHYLSSRMRLDEKITPLQMREMMYQDLKEQSVQKRPLS